MSVHQVTGSVELPPKFLRLLKEDDQDVITVEEKLFFFFSSCWWGASKVRIRQLLVMRKLKLNTRRTIFLKLMQNLLSTDTGKE